jgi:hypothetical protein
MVFRRIFDSLSIIQVLLRQLNQSRSFNIFSFVKYLCYFPIRFQKKVFQKMLCYYR